jgi:hypothetical protein
MPVQALSRAARVKILRPGPADCGSATLPVLVSTSIEVTERGAARREVPVNEVLRLRGHHVMVNLRKLGAYNSTAHSSQLTAWLRSAPVLKQFRSSPRCCSATVYAWCCGQNGSAEGGNISLQVRKLVPVNAIATEQG